MSRERGATLIELVVAMAVFTVFLVVFSLVMVEYRRLDAEVGQGWLLHPDEMAVIARMRRDVSDARGYGEEFNSRSQAPDYLILDRPKGRTITWELQPDAAIRTEWQGLTAMSTWRARAPRQFAIDSWTLPDEKFAVRLLGRSTEGVTIVDQIFTPRPE